MSNEYFKLARELGNALLKSEQSLRLADAYAENNDTEISRVEPEFSFLLEQVIEMIKETTNTAGSNNHACCGCKGCGI